MKILVLSLFLYFSIFSACVIYAGNDSLIANYPSPSASYNKIVINTQTATPVGCSSSNVGLLFMHTDPFTAAQTLQLCANLNGTATLIPFGTACFNRYCTNGGTPVGTAPNQDPTTSCPVGSSNFSVGNNCPSGFTQATTGGGADQVDSFSVANGITVYSIVCCYTLSSSSVYPVF
jgi:hypothetical protein